MRLGSLTFAGSVGVHGPSAKRVLESRPSIQVQMNAQALYLH